MEGGWFLFPRNRKEKRVVKCVGGYLESRD